MQRLSIRAGGRYLQLEDGTPFFWLGDTAWELFHRLDREAASQYLQDRAQKKFTVIQAVALAEKDGLTVGNAYGRTPLLRNAAGEFDPSQPDLTTDSQAHDGYHYWEHVDYIMDLAASLNLYVGLLPTWGDKFNLLWGPGPVIFNPVNAFQYGEWIGSRYKNCSNLVWILGGDRNPETEEQYEIIRSMARGIKFGGAQQLMTYHPRGPFASSAYFHHDEWLDVNMIQSGHFMRHAANYEMIEHDYRLLPAKPTLDGEPRYEGIHVKDEPENCRYTDDDVRQAAYWSVFAGACGFTYGHNSIWSMQEQTNGQHALELSWQEALNAPGGNQMRHLRALVESQPYYEGVPDQSSIQNTGSGPGHIRAFRGNNFAWFYAGIGQSIDVRLGLFDGSDVKASWFNPRNGSFSCMGSFNNEGTRTFQPPGGGSKQDWILVLEGV